jgi:hypothetical protein
MMAWSAPLADGLAMSAAIELIGLDHGPADGLEVSRRFRRPVHRFDQQIAAGLGRGQQRRLVARTT